VVIKDGKKELANRKFTLKEFIRFMKLNPKDKKEILREVRHILKTPEMADIREHAKDIMTMNWFCHYILIPLVICLMTITIIIL